MKLPRPYIPLRVRVEVAERQYQKRYGNIATVRKMHKRFGFSDAKRLRSLLDELFAKLEPGRLFADPSTRRKVELHHRPALCNRVWCRDWAKERGEVITYDPPANDPDFLVYLPTDEHDIETRIRGQHGDYSDLAKARKRKRKERKAKRRKVRWPSRPLRSANRWPKKGKQNERFKAR